MPSAANMTASPWERGNHLKKLLILATAAAGLSFLLRERAVYRAGMVKQRYFGSNGCHPTPTQIAIELMAQGLEKGTTYTSYFN